jgi:hypothetical protein
VSWNPYFFTNLAQLQGTISYDDPDAEIFEPLHHNCNQYVFGTIVGVVNCPTESSEGDFSVPTNISMLIDPTADFYTIHAIFNPKLNGGYTGCNAPTVPFPTMGGGCKPNLGSHEATVHFQHGSTLEGIDGDDGSSLGFSFGWGVPGAQPSPEFFANPSPISYTGMDVANDANKLLWPVSDIIDSIGVVIDAWSSGRARVGATVSFSSYKIGTPDLISGGTVCLL